MRVTADHQVDGGREVADDVDDRARHAGARVDRARSKPHRLRAALVDEHDDCLGALAAQVGSRRVDSGRLIEEVDILDPGGTHDEIRALQRQADEANFHPIHRLDGGGEDRLAGVLIDDIGGQELEVRALVGMAGIAAVCRMAAAVLDAQQLVDALVELVVADGRHVHADEVQRLDRRLIVECRGDEWRPADVVTSGDDQGVARIRRLEVLDVVGQKARPPARSQSGASVQAWSLAAEPTRPLDPVGGSRLPWKSLIASSWTLTAWGGVTGGFLARAPPE